MNALNSYKFTHYVQHDRLRIVHHFSYFNTTVDELPAFDGNPAYIYVAYAVKAGIVTFVFEGQKLLNVSVSSK